MQQTQRKVRTEENPVDRDARRVDTLLRDIRDDAKSLSESYPKETVVPEGGE